MKFPVAGLCVAIICMAGLADGTDIPGKHATPSDVSLRRAVAPHEPVIVRFSWKPTDGPLQVYDTPEPEDQHRIMLYGGAVRGGNYPVVVGFHGQPKRGKRPREYKFLKTLPALVSKMVDEGALQPFILVLPVFRFFGQNWPGFDPGQFRKEVEKQLKSMGISVSDWYLFGHSGAAGCGGEGLNLAHEMAPRAVGFFDTCLGEGWQAEVKQLKKKGIETINIHSVETAGFRPRQRPEYQSTFDFGRAYGPVGMKPVTCPDEIPGNRLREQPFQCAATSDGVIRGYVVDTGEGSEAHEGVLDVAVPYFLKHFIGVPPR